ncbi:hypothetical protein M231_00743 [Tremella mesenterica]|uniref:IMD domain-containing protein n=1 Tax=Tremella mesenterica TaxID=5217 RepID=A0A4Q1BVE9_TREME|nr:hypothetical protein M231_00743 [Tremella mesenterica]
MAPSFTFKSSPSRPSTLPLVSPNSPSVNSQRSVTSATSHPPSPSYFPPVNRDPPRQVKPDEALKTVKAVEDLLGGWNEYRISLAASAKAGRKLAGAMRGLIGCMDKTEVSAQTIRPTAALIEQTADVTMKLARKIDKEYDEVNSDASRYFTLLAVSSPLSQWLLMTREKETRSHEAYLTAISKKHDKAEKAYRKASKTLSDTPTAHAGLLALKDNLGGDISRANIEHMSLIGTKQSLLLLRLASGAGVLAEGMVGWFSEGLKVSAGGYKDVMYFRALADAKWQNDLPSDLDEKQDEKRREEIRVMKARVAMGESDIVGDIWNPTQDVPQFIQSFTSLPSTLSLPSNQSFPSTSSPPSTHSFPSEASKGGSVTVLTPSVASSESPGQVQSSVNEETIKVQPKLSVGSPLITRPPVYTKTTESPSSPLSSGLSVRRPQQPTQAMDDISSPLVPEKETSPSVTSTRVVKSNGPPKLPVEPKTKLDVPHNPARPPQVRHVSAAPAPTYHPMPQKIDPPGRAKRHVSDSPYPYPSMGPDLPILSTPLPTLAVGHGEVIRRARTPIRGSTNPLTTKQDVSPAEQRSHSFQHESHQAFQVAEGQRLQRPSIMQDRHSWDSQIVVGRTGRRSVSMIAAEMEAKSAHDTTRPDHFHQQQQPHQPHYDRHWSHDHTRHDCGHGQRYMGDLGLPNHHHHERYNIRGERIRMDHEMECEICKERYESAHSSSRRTSMPPIQYHPSKPPSPSGEKGIHAPRPMRAVSPYD